MATDERAIPGLDDIEAVLALAAAATATDGVGPLSEQTLLALRNPADYPDVVHLFARESDGVVGYAQVAKDAGNASGEVVVHPAFRGKGLGRRLVESALAAARDAGVPLAIWAHGEHPAALALARSLGLVRSRVLFKMCRPLERPLPPVRLPDDVRLRPFVVGADDAAWLRVNARAFATHPEQGKWTRHDLELRQREPWFDPAGFLLAVPADEPTTLLGFHWTKRELTADGAPGPEGEVYVVGVDPDAQGLRLGTALTLAGLDHLKNTGATEAALYVDESNARAVRMYAGLGFEVCETHVMYGTG
ncbi:mycothiol synthase [Cryptosporangium minutisporangium]|uniref:Mycothiol acetyltransferase n=1 Tax=Cryptosporangium minutisporangium TaxID=113569 RepID=A0ABP6T7W5_9ACTN